MAEEQENNEQQGTDALEARLAALEAKYQAQLDDDEAHGTDGDVKALQKRLKDNIAARREMASDFRTFRQELEKAKTQTGEIEKTWQQRLEEATAAKEQEFAGRLEQFAAMSAEDLLLSDHGIKDDLGRNAARTAFQALPEDARSEKNVAQWWGETTQAWQAHQADPENVEAPSIPRTMIGYLPQPAKGAPKTRMPNTERNRAPVKGDVTAADINAAKDMAEFKALRDRLFQMQRKG